jgi:hypothetical protein
MNIFRELHGKRYLARFGGRGYLPGSPLETTTIPFAFDSEEHSCPQSQAYSLGLEWCAQRELRLEACLAMHAPAQRPAAMT